MVVLLGRRRAAVHAAAVGGLLDSITRAKLLEACAVEERTCTLDDVRAAEEAFIASTVREVMPIVVVGDIELPSAPGPVTRDGAHAALRALVERELAAAGRFT